MTTNKGIDVLKGEDLNRFYSERDVIAFLIKGEKRMDAIRILLFQSAVINAEIQIYECIANNYEVDEKGFDMSVFFLCYQEKNALMKRHHILCEIARCLYRLCSCIDFDPKQSPFWSLGLESKASIHYCKRMNDDDIENALGDWEARNLDDH